MYTSGSVLGASTVVGAVVLPNTSGNAVGHFLAYTAIFVGAAALVGKVLVMVVRRATR